MSKSTTLIGLLAFLYGAMKLKEIEKQHKKNNIVVPSGPTDIRQNQLGSIDYVTANLSPFERRRMRWNNE